jgi:hypothetical protein
MDLIGIWTPPEHKRTGIIPVPTDQFWTTRWTIQIREILRSARLIPSKIWHILPPGGLRLLSQINIHLAGE